MACAPSSALDLEARELECSVCHEEFTEPKILPCGHIICFSCLLTWIKKNNNAQCPLCRHDIVNPKERGGKTLEDVANDLPTDLSMEVLLEARRILDKEHQCCVCDDVLATSYCLVCKDMLCQSCKKAHGKLSMSKHHAVEDLSTLTAEKLAANYSSACSSHPEETPKLFCSNHDTPMCLLCASLKHKSCHDIQDLAEKMQTSRLALENLIIKLTDGETKLDKAIDELDQHHQATEKYLDAIIDEIDVMCDRLDAAVKQNRQRMKELIQKTRGKIKDAVNEGKACLLLRKTKMTTHKQIVERAKNVTNRQVVTSMSSKMERRVDDLNFKVTLPEDAADICDVKFSIDPAAVSRIEQELAKLGDIKTEPADLEVIAKATFCFHHTHGTGVTLSNNDKTATKTADGWNGIVFSRDPMQINRLYEVHVDKFDTTRRVKVGINSLLVGVVSPSPDSIILPNWSGYLTQAVAVFSTWVKPFNTSNSSHWDRSNKVGAALATLKANSRAGVSLDSARRLHVYVDGKDQGVAASNVPDPCYAMFDVCDYTEQVTALPLTTLSG